MADARERGILRSRITYIILYARLHGTRHGYCVYPVLNMCISVSCMSEAVGIRKGVLVEQ
jgi:hypothetical protein